MEILISGVQIAAFGITVVFLALLVISAMVSSFDYIDSLMIRVTSSNKKSTPQLETEQKTLSPKRETLSPEIIAVISTAVAVAVDKRFKIKHVRYRRRPAQQSWALQGRATIMASHAIDR